MRSRAAPDAGAWVVSGNRGCGGPPITLPPSPAQMQAQLQQCLAQQRAAELSQLLTDSGIALAITALAAFGLGWLVAGRVLRPLRTITAAARRISATSLHERLALAGPDDELKELGDTFDGLLGRLEAAFAAQRQFVANASHELRTPLARQRTLVEVALGDPAPSEDSLRAVCERVLVAGTQQERLIDSLLTLARSQRGLDVRRPVDLAALARDAVRSREPEARRRGLDITAVLDPAHMLGDASLAERLIANLLDNALRYNEPGGWIQVGTGTRGALAAVGVSNSGPVIPAGETGRLFQPFQRLAADRTSQDSPGLGLSIVAAIAAAHGAQLRARPRPPGGLDVAVHFPAAPPAGLAGAASSPAPRPKTRAGWPQPARQKAFAGTPAHGSGMVGSGGSGAITIFVCCG